MLLSRPSIQTPVTSFVRCSDCIATRLQLLRDPGLFNVLYRSGNLNPETPRRSDVSNIRSMVSDMATVIQFRWRGTILPPSSRPTFPAGSWRMFASFVVCEGRPTILWCHEATMCSWHPWKPHDIAIDHTTPFRLPRFIGFPVFSCLAPWLPQDFFVLRIFSIWQFALKVAVRLFSHW